MPTYVYRREDGTTFEIQQRITEDPLETCPETGQKVQRVISGSAGLIFKGEGFYLTDYARKNGEKASKSAESKGSDAKSSESTSSSESKSSSSDTSNSGGKEAA